MRQNRSIPPVAVIPELAYPDVDRAVTWLCDCFGFVERLRIGNHRAQLLVGSGAAAGAIVVMDRSRDGPEVASSAGHSVLVRVENVDAHFARAVATGAEIILPPTTHPYGERQYSARDVGGHRWTFSETVGDIDPASWGGTLPRATGPLRLVAHDPEWAKRFATEAKRMRAVIAAHVDSIEHVGSTSVPGLLAKPVLDVAIAVSSDSAADACIAPLEGLGYVYRGPYGDDPRRRYYVRDDAEGRRFAHIHLYVLPAPAYAEKLAFRDALRADPALATAYAAEKQRVADAVGWDKAAYSRAKGFFVQRVLDDLRRSGTLA